MSEIENPIPETPDKCAAAAEIEYLKVGSLGRRRLLAALDVGRLMTEAKEQLGHRNWEPAVKKWREEGTITFSDRSLRRWMLMAEYEEEIKSASLADLTKAERFARDLKKKATVGDGAVEDRAEEEAETPEEGKSTPGSSERARKREVIRRLSSGFIEDLDREDLAFLEFLLRDLPEWRPGFLALARLKFNPEPATVIVEPLELAAA